MTAEGEPVRRAIVADPDGFDFLEVSDQPTVSKRRPIRSIRGTVVIAALGGLGTKAMRSIHPIVRGGWDDLAPSRPIVVSGVRFLASERLSGAE